MIHSKFIINVDSFGHLKYSNDDVAKTDIEFICNGLQEMFNDRINKTGIFKDKDLPDDENFFKSVGIQKDLNLPDMENFDIVIRHNTENRLFYPSKKILKSTSIDPERFSRNRLALGHKVSHTTEQEKKLITHIPTVLFDVSIFIFDSSNFKARNNLSKCLGETFQRIVEHPTCGSQVFAFGFDELKDRIKNVENVRDEDLYIIKMDTLRRRIHQIYLYVTTIYEIRDKSLKDINYKFEDELAKKFSELADAGTPDGLEFALV